ncbi:phosphoglycerate mutase-like protein [Wolfiporia cocos MD-104 SS10]|uniref:Phosphoglycerate mutase-like protein n=1 Tax=Wolfiporia cocos (strain MD-104) TaxID=742152 RepID=A0A2H3JDQ6_WOLCO|nr:phosphoglycerate mutase-like protein [Wolfiporia cocos MD-104 SS10]
MSESVVIGAVIIARHGDRQEFYQDPDTYAVTSTEITPLGEAQEWQLGNLLRSIYLNATSPSYIMDIAPYTSTFDGTQVEVYADNSGTDEVIMDSCAAAVQGMWQATTAENITLANGTTITSPLGGYQYVPINAVDPDTDLSLEGTTDCTAFSQRTESFYNSSMFAEKAKESAAFLDELSPYVGGRSVELSNMWNIYDYMNVQSVHNATYTLPAAYLEQAFTLASWHEYNVFSDSSFTGVGNIAFQTMLPGVLSSFQRIANSSDPLKLSYYEVSYKPFMSLFNMTGVNNAGVPAALVDYASSIVLEVRQSESSTEPLIRFQFKNGSADANFTRYSMSFSGWNGASGADVPLSTFLTAFEPAAINTTLQWCNVCGQTTERGCATALAAADYANGSGARHQKITPVGAGFLGAGLTAAVFLMALGVLLLLGVLTLGAGRFRRRRSVAAAEKRDTKLRGDELELHSEANSLAQAQV